MNHDKLFSYLSFTNFLARLSWRSTLSLNVHLQLSVSFYPSTSLSSAVHLCVNNPAIQQAKVLDCVFYSDITPISIRNQKTILISTQTHPPNDLINKNIFIPLSSTTVNSIARVNDDCDRWMRPATWRCRWNEKENWTRDWLENHSLFHFQVWRDVRNIAEW